MNTGTQRTKRRFEPLVARLRTELRSRRLRPGERVGSEKALARETGLSRNSVRLAIGRLVDEGLIERRPGRGIFARDATTVRHAVQIIVPSLEHDMWVKVVRGAQVVGRQNGIEIQVLDVHMNEEADIRALERLPRSEFRGAIVGALHHARFTKLLYRLDDVRYPFVLVDQELPHTTASSVTSDNYGGAYALGTELVKVGHRRIAFVGWMGAQTVQQRLCGLRDAVMDAGIPFDRKLVLDNAVHDPATIERITQELVQRPDRPTAIFFCNDHNAAIGLRALRKIGVRVPHDVSIAGFDDNPLCELVDPPLTTVRQDAAQMGATAMELLVKRLGGTLEGTPEAAHRTVPAVVVSRASVSAPAK